MKKITCLLSLLLLCAGAMKATAQGLLDRSGWTVTTSGECDDSGTGHAAAITDGNTGTFWHSNWGGSNKSGDGTQTLPQFFQVDLGSEQTFEGIAYMPRFQNGAPANGSATSFEVYVSNTPFVTPKDGTTSIDASVKNAATIVTEVQTKNTPYLTGSINYTGRTSSKYYTFSAEAATSARYVLFVITGSGGARPNLFGSCIEFYLSASDATTTYETLNQPFFKEQLNTLLTQAKSNIGSRPGTYSQTSIDNAQAVYDNETATADEIDAAKNALLPNQPQANVVYRILSAYTGYESNQHVKKAMYSNGTKLMWGTEATSDASQYWLLTPNGDNTFTMQNIEDDLYATNDRTMNTTGAGQVKLVMTEAGVFNIRIGNGGTLHTEGHGGGNGTGGNVVNYGTWGSEGSNSASSWRIVEASYEEMKSISKSAHAFTTAYGRIVNDYVITEEDANAFNSALAAATTTEEASQVLREQLPINMDKVVLSADKYYRIVCLSPKTGNHGDINYNTLTRGASNVVTAPYSKSNVDQIWQFVETTGGYKLKNANAGQYIDNVVAGNGLSNRANLSETGDVLTLSEYSATHFRLNCDESGNPIFAENNPEENYAVGAWNSGDNSASSWYIVEVNDLEVALHTVDGVSYASAYLPFPVQGEGIYTGTIDGNGSSLNMTAQTGVVPAETGIVIKSPNTTATLTIGGTPTTISENSLTGSLTAVTENLTSYLVLGVSNDNTGIGFFTPSENLHTIAANKAYLLASEVPDAMGALAMNFGGEATGVGTVITENGIQSNAPVFDLSGRRVMQTVKGGLYIQNGKKFIVK